MLERNSFYDIRGLLQKRLIPFLCCMKLDAFYSVDGFDVSGFENLSEQSFYFRKAIIKLEKLVGINSNDLGIFQDLDSLSAWLSRKQALNSCNNIILERKAFCYINTIFVIVYQTHSFSYEINCFARMANWLQVLVFRNRNLRADI